MSYILHSVKTFGAALSALTVTVLPAANAIIAMLSLARSISLSNGIQTLRWQPEPLGKLSAKLNKATLPSDHAITNESNKQYAKPE